jgi:regulator of protease activity HflC (stomatin/prohibitin superfamily)
MLLKFLLLGTGIAFAASAGVLLLYRLFALALRKEPLRFGTSLRLAALGCLTLLFGESIAFVPNGMAGVRVSQVSGTRPGTLYPGVHFVKPIVESVALYDTREHVLTLSTVGDAKQKLDGLQAQSREGLIVGLAVSVRYRLDPQRLDYIHANLPVRPEEELVPPIVGSVFRELVPNFMVREIFATRREELRKRAAEIITGKLGADAILVKEVMLRDVVLPQEYARGLEGLLLKEQENERMVYDLQVKEKEVRAAELEAEAAKVRAVKQAEAAAQVHVLQAKAEADAMQHTLPLKEKQIQQSRLEAEARKEATLMNADAAAQAKVIESKADVERMRLMADADANRIRVTSAADSVRLGQEAAVLRENPLLIQKIVAERLSDKMQIMMVPMDGHNFFANDVFRSVSAPLLSALPSSPAPSPKQQPKMAKRQ